MLVKGLAIRSWYPGLVKGISPSEKTVQTASGAHPASYPTVFGFLSSRHSGPGLKLTTHSHLVPKVIMTGAIHPLPLYPFTALTGTTFISPVLGVIRLQDCYNVTAMYKTAPKIKVILVVTYNMPRMCIGKRES